MTFGEFVAHIVQTNLFICSGIGSTPLADDSGRTEEAVGYRWRQCAGRGDRRLITAAKA
jgi:hypothetical protein